MLDELPLEVLCLICDYMSSTEQLTLSMTCVWFHQLMYKIHQALKQLENKDGLALLHVLDYNTDRLILRKVCNMLPKVRLLIVRVKGSDILRDLGTNGIYLKKTSYGKLNKPIRLLFDLCPPLDILASHARINISITPPLQGPLYATFSGELTFANRQSGYRILITNQKPKMLAKLRTIKSIEPKDILEAICEFLLAAVRGS